MRHYLIIFFLAVVVTFAGLIFAYQQIIPLYLESLGSENYAQAPVLNLDMVKIKSVAEKKIDVDILSSDKFSSLKAVKPIYNYELEIGNSHLFKEKTVEAKEAPRSDSQFKTDKELY